MSFTQSCDQSITGRNLPFSRALEIVQNEEYLDEADLDIIRRRHDINIIEGCPLFEYLFEYFFWKFIHYSNNFLTEYSNNKILLNKPYKNVNF
jgi:hypothetical protein